MILFNYIRSLHFRQKWFLVSRRARGEICAHTEIISTSPTELSNGGYLCHHYINILMQSIYFINRKAKCHDKSIFLVSYVHSKSMFNFEIDRIWTWNMSEVYLLLIQRPSYFVKWLWRVSFRLSVSRCPDMSGFTWFWRVRSWSSEKWRIWIVFFLWFWWDWFWFFNLLSG